jgi:hypothetical protein
MNGAPFDVFIALDGPGLNGFEGPGGIARLRCSPAEDRYETEVRFFEGVAGGHATQINPPGTIGFLGNLSQQLLFFDPRTLEEIRRFSARRINHGRAATFYESATHVVWLSEKTFVTVMGAEFWEFDFDDLDHPQAIGPHGVTLPHAVKLSPSRRYLFYGAMDHDRKGYANHVGVFDLQKGRPQVVELDATVWHVGVHPSKDVFYAPTQRCAPQGRMEFTEYVPSHFKNHLYEIEAVEDCARVTRHLSIPKDLPAHLTSDVVVTDRQVIYNNPASSVISVAELETFRGVRYIDERVGLLRSLLHWRSAWSNLLEAMSRVNIPTHTHDFFKALRVARWSLLDGSYGLQLSPDGRFLLSAHRGLNQVIVYRWPEAIVARRLRFPPARKFFPRWLGILDDTRLGFHHSALSTESAQGGPAC